MYPFLCCVGLGSFLSLENDDWERLLLLLISVFISSDCPVASKTIEVRRKIEMNLLDS